MTSFEWQGKALATYGQIATAMRRIYEITDSEERQRTADAFMAAYRAVSPHADANVGYLTGYEGHETMVGMLRLFRVNHPVFGPAELADRVTPEGAFAAGQAIGERMRREGQN